MSEAVTASRLSQVIREGIEEEPVRAPAHPLWERLRELGTELWLDTGDMELAAATWSAEFTALTTNNTLLNQEIQKGLYDAWIPQAVGAAREDFPDIPEQELVLEIAFALNARHGLRLVERFGAFVSVELHTDLAHDVERSVAYGRRYHALCPDHFIVKVPLTPAGLVAARQLEEEGIPVNFTLGFSARQNFLVTCVARPSWCNVFMGRLNAWTAAEGLGDGRLVGERATLASQAAVRELREALGAPTRQIGASMRDGGQVATLAGLDVYTMPVKVAREFLASGIPAADLRDRTGDALEPAWADGVDPAAEGLDGLWEVPEAFRRAGLELAAREVPDLTPEGIVQDLEAAGQGQVFPELTEAELACIRADGKLPRRATWREDVLRGRIGLDALFTLAGLYSFAADQAALDERIRTHLSGS